MGDERTRLETQRVVFELRTLRNSLEYIQNEIKKKERKIECLRELL